MSVDFTAALKIKPPEPPMLPALTPATKGGAGSFSKELAKSDRGPKTDSPVDSQATWRKSDPPPKKTPKPEAPPTTAEAPRETKNEPESPTKTEVTPEEAATPVAEQAPVEDTAEEETLETTANAPQVVIPPIVTPTIPTPPPVPTLPQPVLKVSPAVDTAVVVPEADAVGVCGIEPPETTVVVPPVAAVTDAAAVVPQETVAVESPVIVSESRPQSSKSIKQPSTIFPPKEAPAVEALEQVAPSSMASETEPATETSSVEPAAPKAESKEDRRDERPERETETEIEPIVATSSEPIATPSSSDSTTKDDAAKPTDTPPPVTNDAAANTTVEARPPSDAPQPTSVTPPAASPARFPPNLTGRTTSAREATARPDVDTTRFLRRVVGAFQAAEERGTDVKLRLRPPELGALQISVKIQDGAMTATLEAETPSAKTLIMDNLPQLRERLSEQGLRIEKFEVNVSDRQSGGGTPDPGPQSRDQSQQQQAARMNAPRGTAREESVPRPPRLGPDAAGLNVLV